MGKVLSYSEKKKKTRTIQWEELTNEMDPGIDSCLTPLNPLGHTAWSVPETANFIDH